MILVIDKLSNHIVVIHIIVRWQTMTNEELLKDLQQDWDKNNEERITKEYWTDVIIIWVEDNCDEVTTIDENGNEILCIDWVLNHFRWDKPFA